MLSTPCEQILLVAYIIALFFSCSFGYTLRKLYLVKKKMKEIYAQLVIVNNLIHLFLVRVRDRGQINEDEMRLFNYIDQETIKLMKQFLM